MFRAYEYLSERLPRLEGIQAVYRVSGLSSLEELVKDVRNVRFPCVAVDTGADGILNIRDGWFDKSFHTLYVLEQVNGGGTDAAQVQQALELTARIGRQIMKMMYRDSADPDQPCYGFDSTAIQYDRFGPVGLQAYGYSFSFTMNRDHVFQ